MLKIDQNLIFTIINILVLYWILRKFLFKPVMNVMEQRRKLIEGGLADAREKTAAADSMKAEYEAKLSKAEADSREILEASRKQAREERSQMIQQAEADAKEVLEKNRVALEAQKEAMLASVHGEVARLAVEAAGKILGEKQDPAADAAMYDAFLHANGADASDNAQGQTGAGESHDGRA